MNLHNFTKLFYLHINTTDDDNAFFKFRINIINHSIKNLNVKPTKAFTFMLLLCSNIVFLKKL